MPDYLPHATDKYTTVGKKLQSCLDREIDIDYLLMMSTTMSTTFSVNDSSCSSEGTITHVQSTIHELDLDSISTTDFGDYDKYEQNSTFSMTDSSCSSEDTSLEIESLIKKLDTHDVSAIEKNKQCKPSISELASERLYLKGIERSKRHLLLGAIQNVDFDRASNAGFKACGKHELNSTFSMNHSYCSSEDVSVELQPIIKRLDADSSNTASSVKYGENEKRKPSVSAVACERLYCQAVKKKKEKMILGETFYSMEMRNDPPSLMINNLTCKNGVNARDPMESTFDSKVLSLDKKRENNEPSSTRSYFHIQAMHRRERIASSSRDYYQYFKEGEKSRRNALLQRRGHHEERSKSTLEPKQRSRQKCFEKLYALSKGLQENGKKRREYIESASKKEFIHPKEKISIANATRLYDIGMEKILAKRKNSK